MSFFPRTLVSPDAPTSFTPLFRLLDDFDTYSRGGNQRGHLKSFNPRFDVKELSDSYELHGEVPGIEQKDVEIEFTDPQTITIRGRTERSYTSGTPGASIKTGKHAGAITEGSDADAASNASHKATVEDEDAPQESQSSEVTTIRAPAPAPAETEASGSRYWVSERSVGEFSRSFSFPARVDQDAVKASMKNGILSIVVPKAKKVESRKIAIN